MPRTLSTQAPEQLADRVERLAAEEGRNRSQVVLAAVEFWSQLSPEAHLAITRVQAMGEEMRTRLLRQLEREALDFQFTAVRERIAATMTVPEDISIRVEPSDDDGTVLDAAEALVAKAAGARRAR